MFLVCSINFVEDFNPRPPRGGRPSADWDCSGWFHFNPRPPRGGRPHQKQHTQAQHKKKISIHAPREGGDSGYQYEDLQLVVISIHAPREGGDFMFLRRGPRNFLISIHAPREGGDFMFLRRGPRNFLISIHAPREGGDSKDAQFYL